MLASLGLTTLAGSKRSKGDELPCNGPGCPGRIFFSSSPVSQLTWLQSVERVADHLVLAPPSHASVSATMHNSLHWLSYPGSDWLTSTSSWTLHSRPAAWNTVTRVVLLTCLSWLFQTITENVHVRFIRSVSSPRAPLWRYFGNSVSQNIIIATIIIITQQIVIFDRWQLAA